MIYDMTFNPSMFEGSGEVSYWKRVEALLHDAEINGMVAMLRGDALRREIAARVSAIPDPAKGKIVEYLKRMKDRGRFYKPSPARAETPSNSADWLREALAVCDRDGLFAVLARQEVLQQCAETKMHPCCLDVEWARDSDLWRERRQSAVIGRNRDEVVTVLKPVLRHSKRIQLVDYLIAEQHTSAPKRRNAIFSLKVIGDCIRCWGSGGQPRVEFFIDTEMPRDKTTEVVVQQLATWSRSLAEAIPADGAKVAVRLWRRGERRKLTRNRYLISNLGVIQVGKGFDPGPAEQTDMPESLALMEPPGDRVIEAEFDELDLVHVIDLRQPA